MKKVLIVSVLGVLLAGCLTNGMTPQQGIGTVGGAAVGGLLGSRFGHGNGRLAATAVGTAVGALAGNMITQPQPAPVQYAQPEYYPPQPQYYHPQPQPRRHHHRPRTRQKPVVHNHYYESGNPTEHYWY